MTIKVHVEFRNLWTYINDKANCTYNTLRNYALDNQCVAEVNAAYKKGETILNEEKKSQLEQLEDWWNKKQREIDTNRGQLAGKSKA